MIIYHHLIIILSLLSLKSFALSDDVHTYKSKQIKIVNNGKEVESYTKTDNILSLNMSDSTITFDSPSTEIMHFLEDKHHFRFTTHVNISATLQMFTTDSDFFFTFDHSKQVIQVSKKGENPGLHSIWLEHFVE